MGAGAWTVRGRRPEEIALLYTSPRFVIGLCIKVVINTIGSRPSHQLNPIVWQVQRILQGGQALTRLSGIRHLANGTVVTGIFFNICTGGQIFIYGRYRGFSHRDLRALALTGVYQAPGHRTPGRTPVQSDSESESSVEWDPEPELFSALQPEPQPEP